MRDYNSGFDEVRGFGSRVGRWGGSGSAVGAAGSGFQGQGLRLGPVIWGDW